MKQFAIILIAIGLPFLSFTQQTISTSMTHDGVERDYILYVPASYSGDSPVPLIFNFHGYGSNATEQMFYGDFRPIADTANFIVVHPEGTLLNGITHWNVGGWTLGSTTDDVGFTEAMIDTITAVYNINSDRIYATGMSNGGFMSFLLACQLSEKIAAIASVTGSMTPEIYNDCNAQHPTPILQMHGTIDPVVPYNGANWTKSINDVLAYWVDYNNCNTTATTVDLANTTIVDASTVDHIVYDEGNNSATVEHFKVSGGGHTWPGSAIVLAGTNYDIDASDEIWKFFSRYDINGLIVTTDMEELGENNLQLNVYPNPTNARIHLEHNFTKALVYELISPFGERVMTGLVNSNNQTIDLSHLAPNVYFLKVGDRVFKVLKII